MLTLRVRLSILACAVLGTACSSDPGPPIEVDCPVTGRYMSLRTGASWTYRVTKNGSTNEKTQTVGALEDIGGQKAGVMAFRLTTTKPGGMVVSWQADTGSAIVRHREQDLAGTVQSEEYYLPFRTRIDEASEHLVVGATWSESYDESVTDLATGTTTTASKTETWFVEADDEGVAVPAGDFCTLRLKRTSSVNGAPTSTKFYWFTRGVGKIKERATGGETEELTAYTP